MKLENLAPLEWLFVSGRGGGLEHGFALTRSTAWMCGAADCRFAARRADSITAPCAGKFVDCWRGERMDMDLAVDLMIQKSRKGENVPAGTS